MCIPTGGLLAHFLYTNLFFNNFNDSGFNKIKINFLLLREKITKGDRTDLLPPITGEYIFNYTGKFDKLLDFFRPLYSHFESSEIIFISKQSEPANELSGSTFIYPKNLSKRAKHEWMIHFKETENYFNKLEPKLRELQISPTLFKYLRYCLIKQTQKLFFFLEYIEHSKPKAVLTDHDRQMINSSLILAAKAKGVPTFTFIHGSTDPAPDFIPLLADYMFCWGQYHYRQFKQLGVEENRLLITGNPKLRSEIYADANKMRASLQIRDSLVFSFTPNPIDAEEKIKMALQFCSAASQLKNVKAIIKLHPNETKTEYTLVQNDFPEITLLSSDELTNDELFAVSNLIVCHNSTIAIDALIKKIPVIIFRPQFISFPLGIGLDLINKAGCPDASNSAELSELFRKMQSEVERNKVVEKSRSYVNDYCDLFGDEAAKKIIECIHTTKNQRKSHI